MDPSGARLQPSPLLFYFWLLLVQLVGLWIFVQGFLLTRVELPDRSSCDVSSACVNARRPANISATEHLLHEQLAGYDLMNLLVARSYTAQCILVLMSSRSA